MSNSIEKLQITNTEMISDYVEKYRLKLVENYKQIIFANWDEQQNLDLTDELMIEAVSIMQASEATILEMFFEDANDKCVDVGSEEYFNQVFEVATRFP